MVDYLRNLKQTRVRLSGCSNHFIVGQRLIVECNRYGRVLALNISQAVNIFVGTAA